MTDLPFDYAPPPEPMAQPDAAPAVADAPPAGEEVPSWLFD